MKLTVTAGAAGFGGAAAVQLRGRRLMNQRIEIIVTPEGETSVETKGFAGPACKAASQALRAGPRGQDRRAADPGVPRDGARRVKPSGCGPDPAAESLSHSEHPIPPNRRSRWRDDRRATDPAGETTGRATNASTATTRNRPRRARRDRRAAAEDRRRTAGAAHAERPVRRAGPGGVPGRAGRHPRARRSPAGRGRGLRRARLERRHLAGRRRRGRPRRPAGRGEGPAAKRRRRDAQPAGHAAPAPVLPVGGAAGGDADDARRR